MPEQAGNRIRQNITLARKRSGKLGKQNYQALIELSRDYGFSIALGDLLLLDRKWYVTHSGLLSLLDATIVLGFESKSSENFAILPQGAGSLRQPSTNLPAHAASSARRAR
jgi:hypothetical protein